MLAKQPHVAPIAEQRPIYWFGKVVSFIDYHAYLGGWRPVVCNIALESLLASRNTLKSNHMRAPMEAYVPPPPIYEQISDEPQRRGEG